MIISAPKLRIKPPADTWTPPATVYPKWLDQSVYLLVHTASVNVQAALDTYGSIRLEPKNYALNPAGTHPSVPVPAPFVLRTGQKIYGIHGATVLPACTIVAGSSGSLMRGCGGNVTFPASSLVTSGVRIESKQYGTITVSNGTLDGCVFIDLYEVEINFSTVGGGYIRNCRVIRQVTHSPNDSFVWNAAVGDTLSVGNNIVWLNFLTPGAKKLKLSNVPEMAVVHFDVEAPGSDGSPAIDASNMGWLSVSAATGTNSTGEAIKTANVANVAITYPRAYNQASGGASINVIGATKVAQFTHDVGRTRVFNSGAQRVTGYEQQALSPAAWDLVNASTASDVAAIFDATVSRTLTGIAWSAPAYLTPPVVPSMAASSTTRADIQALLNSQGTVYLAPGKYVLDGPLLMGGGRRLIGSGMDQTFIVGVDNTITLFALDTSLPNGNRSLGTFFHLTDMTLANAYRGIWAESTLGTTGTGTNEFQLTATVMHRLCIRDMVDAGFGFTNIFGLDNNYFEHVYFVNCGTGIKHLATQPGSTETNMYLCYMDKSFFYGCQWLNCGKALDLYTTRASGGNTFIECKIDGSTTFAMRAQLYDSLDFYNCDLSNNAGTAGTGVGQSFGSAFITTAVCNLAHCRLIAGAANPAGLFDSANIQFEGCTFARGGASSTVVRNAAGLPGYDLANPANADQFTKHRHTFLNCDLGDVPLGTMPTYLAVNNNSTANPNIQTEWTRRDNGTTYNDYMGPVITRPTGTRLLRNAT